MAAPATSVTLHGRPAAVRQSDRQLNPLPELLQTPSGLALLELQGTLNLPPTPTHGAGDMTVVPIGRLDFPDYRPESVAFDPSSKTWMKRVYMYVGQHQRLTGEVKQLPRALGVVQRQQRQQQQQDGVAEVADDLEVVEVVKYKIVFSSRPEPTGPM